MAKAKKEEVEVEPKAPQFTPLSIDYPNEQLNDMARSVNKIMEYLNGKA